MIQFNLLPKVKLDYVKARRNKRMTVVVATLIGGAALGILLLLFMIVQVFQEKRINDLSKDIETESSKLQSVTDLDKVLTIQNQLNSLTSLHDKKPVASRLTTYIQQITPEKVSIATLGVDFDLNAVSITGSADTIKTINQFVDTLKFTSYKSADKEALAFTSVVLTGFSKNETTKATYQINFNYDPAIFSSASGVKLVIPPGKITTRSITEKPESIFQPLEETKDN